MGRVAKIIEKDKLENIIKKLESENTYTTRSQLFMEVADKYSNLYGVSFSHSCAAQRAKQYGIEIKTQMGERGAHLKGGNADALKKWRETGEVQIKTAKGNADSLIKLYSTEENGKYLKLAKKVKRGSLKSAICLKCLECSNYKKEEIKNCPITTCALFPIRPYQ